MTCLAGGHETTLEDQWKQLEEAADMLAEAPEDELVGELLVLQAELVTQSFSNRQRLHTLLQSLIPDLERQTGNAEARAASTEFVCSHILVRQAALQAASVLIVSSHACICKLEWPVHTVPKCAHLTSGNTEMTLGMLLRHGAQSWTLDNTCCQPLSWWILPRLSCPIAPQGMSSSGSARLQ